MYDFSKMKKENEEVEERLQMARTDYEKHKMSEEQLGKLREKMEEAVMENKKNAGKKTARRFAATAAAVIGAFVILPNTSATIAHAMEQIPVLGSLVHTITFMDYEYEDDRSHADVKVPEIALDEQTEEQEGKENLEHSVKEINENIQEIAKGIVADFEAGLEEKEGYQDVLVKSEVLATAENYFTLKLICFQGAGSGAEWDYYYTIDLNTGNYLHLSDIFEEGSDYIARISDSIKEQMQAQMDADDQKLYWLDNAETEEWNFKSITEETSFYINAEDQVVICFDEGEVAPMYMGPVEFKIPAEVLADIRK